MEQRINYMKTNREVVKLMIGTRGVQENNGNR